MHPFDSAGPHDAGGNTSQERLSAGSSFAAATERGRTTMEFATWSPRMLSVLRIMAALLFIQHGTAKFFGFPGPGPHLTPLLVVQGILELGGGILLLIGFYTRIVAFILSGDMAVAYFMAKAPKSFFPYVNNGDLDILYCFVFLYIFVAGGGAWSVDAQRSSRRGFAPAT
jgi:putative oxidoreductase